MIAFAIGRLGVLELRRFIHVEQVEHVKHTDDLYVFHVLHGQTKKAGILELWTSLQILSPSKTPKLQAAKAMKRDAL